MIRKEVTRVLVAASAVGVLATSCGDGRRTVTLGVPTTVQDSGLLEVLLPEFESAHPALRLRNVAAASGELLALGARGDLDVLLAHAPAAELEFLVAGHGLTRRPVMENDFVLVGPTNDPAGVRGMTDAAAALARVAAAGAIFLSRGDDSGTHQKELALWRAAAVPTGSGYRETGQGMGALLRAATEVGAYALTDRATFLNLEASLELEALVEGDPRLRNIYSVTVVAAARELEGAKAFADWLTSASGREVVAGYGVERFGVPLYRPVVLDAEKAEA